jgi:O-antigen/teichoic acid export membrane protein
MRRFDFEQKQVAWRAFAAILFCIIFLSLSKVLLPRWWEFPVAPVEKLVFAVQLNAFIFIWIMIAVRMVSRVRFYSKEDRAGSAFAPPSKKLAIESAFLQNTLEQSVIAGAMIICVATLLDGADLSLLVGAVALFGIGRLCFYFGYPSGAPGRSFGIVTTVFPSLLGYSFIIFEVLRKIFSGFD